MSVSSCFMAKKSTSQKSKVTIYPAEPYKLSTKFAPRVLIPCEAFDRRYTDLHPLTPDDYQRLKTLRFVTTDGVYAYVEVEMVANNADGAYDELLDQYAQEFYHLPFVTVRAVWRSRYARLDEYWMLIKLTKI